MPPRPALATARALVAVCLLGLLAGCGSSGDDTAAEAASPSASSSPDGAADDGADGDGPAGLPRTAATALPEYDARSSVGELAEGFPSDVVPVAPDSEVLAAPAGTPGEDGLVPITLNLRTAGSVDEVTTYYADVLDDAGFTVSPSKEASALTSLTTFVRGGTGDAPTQSVAIGVFDDEDERLVTISGLVAPA